MLYANQNTPPGRLHRRCLPRYPHKHRESIWKELLLFARLGIYRKQLSGREENRRPLQCRHQNGLGIIERNLFIGNDNIQQDVHEVHSRAVRLLLSGNNGDEVLKFYNNTIWTESDWDYNGTGWRNVTSTAV